MEGEKQTGIDAIGEFGLIDRIKDIIGDQVDETLVKGIGDDAALIATSKNEVLAISTDTLVEGVHFDLSYMPLQHLGYKSVVVSLSDIAAMNGLPSHVTVSVALSSKFSVEAVDEFYKGVKQAAETYGIRVIGGDTTASLKGMMINVSAIGFMQKGKVALRSGSKPKDVICVSGDLGGAFLGMHILEREKQEFKANPEMQPDLDEFSYLVGRQLKPEARIDLIHSMNEIGIQPSSMIDISDGLASELIHLSIQSKNKFKVYEDKIPIAEETRSASMDFSLDPTTAALNGGEDYELLFTLKLEDFEKVKNHPDITAIGYVEEGEGATLVTRSGNNVPIRAQGWNHFRDQS